jgi:membrane AbrB-like protein
MWLLFLILTLGLGTLGGFLVSRLRIPGSLMIGALCAVALFNICSRGLAVMPERTKYLVQIIAASFIGLSMRKEDLVRLPRLVKPMFIMAAGFLILNVAAGFLMYALSPLDLATALMSAVPGGVNETPIIAADMGADAPKVAVMQTLRLIAGLGIFPSLVLMYDRGRPGRAVLPGGTAVPVPSQGALPPAPASGEPAGAPNPAASPAAPLTAPRSAPAGTGTAKETGGPGRRSVSCALTFGCGCAACYLGWRTGIPGMPFVFPIVSALTLRLIFDLGFLPQGLRKIAQVLSGSYLGSGLAVGDLLEMRFLVLPIVILIAGYLLNGIVTGKVLEKTCGFTRPESMLITIPAGASDMALIAADMGIVNADISLLQVTRLILVMAVFPQIINGLIR